MSDRYFEVARIPKGSTIIEAGPFRLRWRTPDGQELEADLTAELTAEVVGTVAVGGPTYTEFELGERAALLQVRSFITQHGIREVDAYCAQRLHDIMMDARPRDHRQA